MPIDDFTFNYANIFGPSGLFMFNPENILVYVGFSSELSDVFGDC